MSVTYHHGSLHAALIAAAEAILEREGIGALTLRAAAREAGVSHAAPTHHFGGLSGLLSALAASGFIRLRSNLVVEADAAGPAPKARAAGLGRGYVAFARAHPGLFLLMFRSEQLDWSNPTLSQAGAAAFGLMSQVGAETQTSGAAPPFQNLVAAATLWSRVHGLAILLIDGRLNAVADRLLPGADIEALIEAVITGDRQQEETAL